MSILLTKASPFQSLMKEAGITCYVVKPMTYLLLLQIQELEVDHSEECTQEVTLKFADAASW